MSKPMTDPRVELKAPLMNWRCEYCKQIFAMAPSSPFAGCPYCGQGNALLVEDTALSAPPSSVRAGEVKGIASYATLDEELDARGLAGALITIRDLVYAAVVDRAAIAASVASAPNVRASALEECARVADDYADDAAKRRDSAATSAGFFDPDIAEAQRFVAAMIARDIRALGEAQAQQAGERQPICAGLINSFTECRAVAEIGLCCHHYKFLMDIALKNAAASPAVSPSATLREAAQGLIDALENQRLGKGPSGAVPVAFKALNAALHPEREREA